eukprot:1159615-Pelagomonas_calceolata.AAC.11
MSGARTRQQQLPHPIFSYNLQLRTHKKTHAVAGLKVSLCGTFLPCAVNLLVEFVDRRDVQHLCAVSLPCNQHHGQAFG